MRSIRVLAPASILTAALLACSASPTNGESVGSQGEPIIGGAVVTTDTIGTALVSVSDGWSCSGTVIDGHWLLTAHHCVTSGNLTTGGTAIAPGDLTASTQSGARATGVAIFRHPTLDVAVVQLGADLLNPATNAPFPAQLFSGDVSTLVGQTVVCQGWGDNTFSTGFGTLRTANRPIAQMDGTSYRIDANGQGQIDWEGDSGGSCYLGSQILGVQSTCEYSGSTVDYCDQVAVENFYAWASSIINLPSDCTFSSTTAVCAQGWAFDPSANVVTESYTADCSANLSLKVLSGASWKAVAGQCESGETLTPPGSCSSPATNTFLFGWQEEGTVGSGPAIGSSQLAIACDSAAHCSQPFTITIPNCDTPIDTFTAAAASVSVPVNGQASTLLTWTGPWVQEDWGLYDTFAITPTVAGLTANVVDLSSPNTPGTYLENGPNYGQGYFSVSAAEGTKLGTYVMSVNATDAASGVTHAIPLQVTVTACVPSVTCSAGSCGTLASDDGCGNGPVVCPSCGAGDSCSDNVCCPVGDTWSATSQKCLPTCSATTPYCALTGTCLSVIACKAAGGGTGGGGGCTPQMAARHECS
jgi:hypothetical protein